MAEIWLLCEGDSDVPVVSAALTTVLAAGILVKPTGGSANAPSAAEYVARHRPDVTVAYVVDRDYFRRDIADATFKDGKRGFMWRRHSIENYLLEPSVIVEAFKRMKASVARRPAGGITWVDALPADETVVANGLRTCAKVRAAQEAARMAMHRLWEDLSDTAGRIEKRIPDVLRANTAPDAATCRKALLDEAARIVAKAHETTTCPHLSPAAVDARYSTEHARVCMDTYINRMHFLEEFCGKDLLRAFLDWLHQHHRARASLKLFSKELEQAFPLVYQANRLIHGTDDFLDLANGVRALAGLASLA